MEEKQEAVAIIHSHTITALQEYMQEKKSSQTAVARACGLSSPVISQVLKGTYAGDLENVLKKIQDFLLLEDERQDAFVSSKFIMTAQSKMVFDVCRTDRLFRFMGLVQARAGLGKTTALREYAANWSNVAMITASTWNASRGAIALLLNSALNVSTTYSTLTGAIQQITNKLGSGALLIVDEAQHLPRETLEGLRYIHDTAGAGIVLSATPQMGARLADKRIGVIFDQLASRIGCRRILSEEVEIDDVEKIVEQVIPRPSEEILNYCHQKANSPGHYRTMTRYLQAATAKAISKKEPIGLKHFRAAEQTLMV